MLSSISFADNWILDSKSKKLPKDLEQRIELAGGKLMKSWDFLGIAVADFPDEGVARAFETEGLSVMPDIEINWIPPNEKIYADHIGSNETYYGYQWHLPVIEADKAWDEGITGAGVRVAVLDTGIWYPHPDLSANIDFGASTTFVPGTADFMDDHGHGTHVAGIIAAIDNDWGSIGVAPNANLIAVKVLNSVGSGAFSWIWDGVIHAVMQDADIINMSLSGYLKRSGEPPDYSARDAAYILSVWNRIANWAASQGVLVVTSAGNDAINHNHNQNWIRLPAEAGNCIAISATGPIGLQYFDNPASYTNYGTSLVWVAAPGGDFQLYPSTGWWLDMVFSTHIGGWAWMAGTSQAAPNVSGVAALILEKYGPMSVANLKNRLAQTSDDLGKPGSDHYYGRGRINAYKAVTNQKK
jgi:subtilisin family serine protease